MQTATITLSVTNDLAGAIIGPKGSTLSAIREHTGTRCGVESTPTPHGERLVTVSSTSAENIVAGVEAVIEALFSAQRPPSTLSFLVHPNAVGALIGKAGSTINQIRAQSNAEVRVQDSGARVLNTYARCDVFSTDKQAIISAALQITQLLFEQYSREDVPGIPDVRHPLSSSGGSGHGGNNRGLGIPQHHQLGQSPNQHTLHPTPAPSPLLQPQQQHQEEAAAAASATIPYHHQQQHHHHHTATMDYAGSGRASEQHAYGQVIRGTPYNSVSATGMYGQFSQMGPPPPALHHSPHHPHHHGSNVSSNASPGGGRGNSGTQYVGLEMIVPKQYLGNVIGKSGKYINAVRLQYAVDVKVIDTFDAQQPQTHQRTPQQQHQQRSIQLYAPHGEPAALLLVQGMREHVWLAAAKCVQNLLVGTPLASRDSNGGSISSPSPPSSPSSLSSREDRASDPDLSVVTETLELDQSAVSRIIGRGGSRINLIRTSSRCRINIEQNQADDDGGVEGSIVDGDRQMATCTIEGRAREVAGARMLIEAKELVVSPTLSGIISGSQSHQILPRHTQSLMGDVTSGGSGVAGGVGMGSSGQRNAALGSGMIGELGGLSGAGGIGTISGTSSSTGRDSVSGTSVLELLLPKRFLGQIIGKAGKHINAARQHTGCEIRVDDSNVALTSATGDPLATLSITGAQSMVWAAAGYAVGRMLMGKPGRDEVDGNVVVETLTIPTEAVGQIIGKSGQRINMIRQSSNCKIILNQGIENGSFAIVTLEGSHRSVLAARTLLQAKEVKASDQAAAVLHQTANPQPRHHHIYQHYNGNSEIGPQQTASDLSPALLPRSQQQQQQQQVPVHGGSSSGSDGADGSSGGGIMGNSAGEGVGTTGSDQGSQTGAVNSGATFFTSTEQVQQPMLRPDSLFGNYP